MTYKRSTVLKISYLLFICLALILTLSCSNSKFLYSKDANRPYIVFLSAEDEYNSAETLPEFACQLEKKYNLDCEVLYGSEKKREGILGMESLASADLVVLYVRRRALPGKQMKYLRDYLERGKALIGLRTASHAFDARGRGPAGCQEWKSFDHDVFGGNYHNHHKKGPETIITTAECAKDHQILNGVQTPFASSSSLYKTSPLTDSTKLLLIGSIPNQEPEPIAWINTYKNSRIFYTSIGSPDDFGNENFRRLLTNAIFWALDRTKQSLE